MGKTGIFFAFFIKDSSIRVKFVVMYKVAMVEQYL